MALTCLALGCFDPAAAVADEARAYRLEATYTGDGLMAFADGAAGRGAYLGLIDMSLAFDTAAAGLWRGGVVRVRWQNTHGATPSVDIVQDLQGFSNIENGDATYLYELWYRQTLGPLSLLVGRHDLNSEFLTSASAADLLNSSFGIMPLASANVPVSIFPRTTLGLVASYQVREGLVTRLGVYEGNPLDLEGDDPYRLRFRLSRQDGLLAVTEVEWSRIGTAGLSDGTYTLGVLGFSGALEQLGQASDGRAGTVLTYALADQTLWRDAGSGTRALSGLAQVGWAPCDRNRHDLYAALGLRLVGPFRSRARDALSLGLARAWVSGCYRRTLAGTSGHETVIEATYKASFGPVVALQPDLQLIFDPGADSSRGTAVVGGMRLHLEF